MGCVRVGISGSRTAQLTITALRGLREKILKNSSLENDRCDVNSRCHSDSSALAQKHRSREKEK